MIAGLASAAAVDRTNFGMSDVKWIFAEWVQHETCLIIAEYSSLEEGNIDLFDHERYC